MSALRDHGYLSDILKSAQEITEFVKDKSLAEFEADRKTILAVTRLLEIIGEATKNLSKELRRNHPEIPWRSYAGLRDVLIHRYSEADDGIVFRTAQEDIPALIPMIEKVLPTVESQ